jgi:hypothetical protein
MAEVVALLTCFAGCRNPPSADLRPSPDSALLSGILEPVGYHLSTEYFVGMAPTQM